MKSCVLGLLPVEKQFLSFFLCNYELWTPFETIYPIVLKLSLAVVRLRKELFYFYL